jgi:hypothetical protein
MRLVENTTGSHRFVEGLETREVDGEQAIHIDSIVKGLLEQRFQSIFAETGDRSCPFMVMCPPMLRTFAELDNLSVIGNIPLLASF